LESTVLALKYTDEAKTNTYLREKLNEILNDWSLLDKVFAGVADSGKNIAAALDNFDGLIRVPCSGHRINSCVNDIYLK